MFRIDRIDHTIFEVYFWKRKKKIKKIDSINRCRSETNLDRPTIARKKIDECIHEILETKEKKQKQLARCVGPHDPSSSTGSSGGRGSSSKRHPSAPLALPPLPVAAPLVELTGTEHKASRSAVLCACGDRCAGLPFAGGPYMRRLEYRLRPSFSLTWTHHPKRTGSSKGALTLLLLPSRRTSSNFLQPSVRAQKNPWTIYILKKTRSLIRTDRSFYVIIGWLKNVGFCLSNDFGLLLHRRF